MDLILIFKARRKNLAHRFYFNLFGPIIVSVGHASFQKI